VQRRVEQMMAEGVEFRTNCHVGVDVSARELRRNFDAICLTGGATKARDLKLPGRDLKGIYFAMDYLVQQNKRNFGDQFSPEQIISAADKRVVVVGGGDTGSDCVGTANRQGARVIYQFQYLPRPPERRTPEMPWPEWPKILRTSHSHEEGVIRDWNIYTVGFSGENGCVKRLHGVRVQWRQQHGRRVMEEIEGTEFTLECDLVLIAAGFAGPETDTIVSQLKLKLDGHGNVIGDDSYMTNVPGVFVAGDMRRGQSLVVWAIWEGREAACAIDRYLMGETRLPSSPYL
jgi:glutamate synthase (NADPH/NADH) small chain